MQPVRAVDSPPYQVDPNALGRFDRRRTAFALERRGAESLPPYEPAGHGGLDGDDLVARIARTVHNRFGLVFDGDRPASQRPAGDHPPAGSDPAANAEAVRRAARRFGADLVGIGRVNPLWVYSHDEDGRPVKLPASHRWAVVLGTAMDAEAIRSSPGPAASAATQLGYMRMAIHAHCVARFVQALGFGAVACRNDTALSIPLAIDAGLGELGRHGLLITPRFGPCVRISKVFTDMPLAADWPIEHGVAEACRECRRCVEACGAGAVSDADEPSFRTVCPANNPGVRRWAVDALACLAAWRRHGRSCSNCIAACPFTPGA